MRIGVDLMGGDTPPDVLLRYLVLHANGLEGIDELVCYLSGPQVEEKIPSGGLFRGVVAESYIEQGEDPLEAVRRKKKSSLLLGLEDLKEKRIDAFISAGNTGAVITAATFVLPKLPGIRRLALLAFVPTQTGQVAVLDVGGFLSPTAEMLVQYAHMGIAVQKALQGIESPRVALLNIGEEAQKGTPTLKEAYQALEHLPSFAGNIEAREVFHGGVDVLVTDGYAGNIFLKTAEGTASLILSEAKETDVLQRFDYRKYPGAIVCGVDALVLKCHGTSSPESLSRSIQECVLLHRKSFLKKIFV